MLERLVPAQELMLHGIIAKTKYVAPSKYGSDHTFMIKTHGQGYMIVNKGDEPLSVRVFKDKFGRKDKEGNLKTYRMFYWEWKPFIKKEEVSVEQAIMNSGMTADKWRSMRPKNL